MLVQPFVSAVKVNLFQAKRQNSGLITASGYSVLCE